MCLAVRYSTKWDRVSIQIKQHRIVGVMLCDFEENVDDAMRKNEKKEIREAIQKIKKQRLNELNVCNKLDWCKNLCLTLQNHFDGEWAVMIGHRAQYRSFHSVLLRDQNDQNSFNFEQSATQKVEFKINNKTNAEFIHFGFGPPWYKWSVVVAKLL